MIQDSNKEEKKNILYVDDQESNVFLLKETFADDYNIFTAYSGKEGLEIVKAQNLDLIISDQSMPGMSGVEFFERVLEINPEPNRIILTAFSNFNDLTDAVNKAQIYQFVSKPWTRDKLKSVIDKALVDYDLRKRNSDLTEKLKFHTAKLRDTIKSKNTILTKLEESKEDLETSEKNLRLLIELSPIAIAISTLSNKIITLNKQFVKSFGYTLEEMPTIEDWYPLAYPNKEYRVNHKKKWKFYFEKAVKNNTEMEPIESIVTCKNGEQKVIQLRSSVIGENFIVMFTDLTKLRNLEEDISYRIKLEEDLLKAKQTAESANKAKSEFIASMSHEIRTPMNAILGFAEVLGQEISDPVLLDYVQSLRSSGKTLLSLINDILDFSKIEAGKIELRLEPVNIRSILQEITDLFKFKFREKKLEFITDVDKDISRYFVLDELRIKQILLNLVSNAIKFTEEGYVKIVVKSSKPINGKVRLKMSVEDSGIGIALEQQEKVFNSFEQMEGQDNRKFGGTGLGLAITTKFVSLMNGSINLESSVNKGSKFSIVLEDVEVVEDKGFDSEKTNFKETPKFKKANILVVDDIDDNRKVFKLFLSRFKFSVTEAENGIQALQKIRDQKPDLVFMDLHMPEMDGYETFQAILEKSEWENIPVVAVTAYTLDNDKEKVINAGFSGFISKPVEFKKIEKVLKQFIEYEVVAKEAIENKEKFEFTDDLLNNLPELNKKIEENVVDLLKKLESIRPKKVVNELAVLIVELGDEYSIKALKKYGNELKIAIKSFNVEKEKELILKISSLIDILQSIEN